ncbi:branched-chain amino acid ABC transporter permease [Rhodoplanes serenus]|uniref:branched-chain amino acid ABC transporter permease n=1 Tax=Rhodoplanes serenus TaxID=200615 RepID=UPI000DAC9101|nr:branched-chain amino acid ABC transporter permease [Rhodoplanes serenus]RAI34654.1 branched-chain amino acid ABC transporter permease [Rhodoplanes serenus]
MTDRSILAASGRTSSGRTASGRPASGRNVELIVFAVLVAGLTVAPLMVYPILLMKVLCFALFACAFNLLIGYGGLLSFGHAMFFGFAAYVSGYTIKAWGFPTELGILAGAAVAAVLGLVAGSIAIRRQGIYFAMVTLALAQMVFFFCLQAPFTGGEDGIQAIPRRPIFGVIDISRDIVLFYVVLAIFAAGFLIIWRTIHSPFGQVLKAIRENEARAISLGYAVDRFKLMAFVLSATLSGLAGATKAVVFQLASLTDVTWQMSGEVVLMTLVGGMGTVFGPIVGAAVIVVMQNTFTGFGEWVLVAQGCIFVLTVLLFRRGIVGEIVALAQRRRGEEDAAPPPVAEPADKQPPSDRGGVRASAAAGPSEASAPVSS